MQINPVSPQVAAPPAVESALKVAPTAVEQKPATAKDSAILSQKAKDLAAQLAGKTAQEEAKESPVVEINEELSKAK